VKLPREHALAYVDHDDLAVEVPSVVRSGDLMLGEDPNAPPGIFEQTQIKAERTCDAYPDRDLASPPSTATTVSRAHTLSSASKSASERWRARRPCAKLAEQVLGEP
jgi:hypothetical protein